MTPHHFTKNTVAADAWCLKCNKRTLHRVDSGRIGPCLTCIKSLDKQHDERKPTEKIKQEGFNFNGN